MLEPPAPCGGGAPHYVIEEEKKNQNLKLGGIFLQPTHMELQKKKKRFSSN